MKLDEYQIDLNRVDEGEWQELPGDPDNFAVLIRGRRSEAYKKARSRKLLKARRALGRNRELLVDQVTAIDNACIAEQCILDWRNMLDKGQPIPHSLDLAKKLMTERKYEPFQEAIREILEEVDEGYSEIEEEVSGN